MIQKDRLVHKIDAIIDSKKRLIPLLNKHISSSLFFSGLKPEERNAVIERFQNIVITQTKHMETLKEIKDEVAKGKSDVY